MIQLSHILFEPVILRENFLSRLDTRIKILSCILFLILNLILRGNIFPISLLLLYLLVSLSWKVKWRYILSRLFIPFLIGVFLILTKTSGLHLALVILSGVSMVALLSFSTPFEDILSALSRLKLSQILIEIFYLMYKFIFIFFDEVSDIYYAQKSRLGYKDTKTSLKSLGVLIGILIIRSFQKANLLYEAILSRGYKDKLFY
ncbi:MAG: hypothetical protein NC898_02055 [Candidatus Omnitrophica bacterium]|nr:hypothetical protein [Candidatus Omnitrophota bacterium]MCM8793236.1 hypothetical protein [Candidatus Omnitrophota bacterium]